MKSKKRLVMFLQGFGLINLIWYLVAVLWNKSVLPTPLQVYAHMGDILNQEIGMHILASLYRVTSGIIIALIIGIAIGLLMANSGQWTKVLGPVVYLTYPTPKTVFLPILMLIFGLGNGSKIILIVLILVFQVIVVTRDSVQNISHETYDMITSLGGSKTQRFLNVTLPAILPELLTNLRVSVGTALSILFFTEAYGTQYGMGFYILDAWSRMDYMNMYLGIIIISLVGFVLFIMIDIIEEHVCKWKQTAPQEG
ncbi:ABC transporter permease [Acetobacterium sp.]|uniref:ABC transporter permease n=1 Tax=Acetobacterium sp. TaxID=1872094 RepID=UPI002F405B4C